MGHDDHGDHLTPTPVLICICNYHLQARCPESIQRGQTGFVPLLMYWLGPMKQLLKVETTRELQRNSALNAWNWSILFQRRNSRALRLLRLRIAVSFEESIQRSFVKKTTSLNKWIARSVVDQYYGLSVVKCRYLAYEFATKNNLNMPDNWAREWKAEVEWMSSPLMMSS